MLISKLKKGVSFILGRHKPMSKLKRYSKYDIRVGTNGAPQIHDWEGTA
jgi:hypothetical protein